MTIRPVLAALAVLVLVASLTAKVRAGEAVIEGVTIGSPDIKQLFRSLHAALDPNDSSISLAISLKKAAEMPVYDPTWHYEGAVTDAKGHQVLHVWILSELKGAPLQDAISAATMLALCDGGYGGPNFKKLYDVYAAKDAVLPASSPDPFLNRHKFATVLASLLN